MKSTTPYERGDIVLVSFPFTDLTATKKRPALVVSPDSFHSERDDLLLAAITSKVVEGPFCIAVEKTDCIEGRLPRRSMVKSTKLFTIHWTLVVKKLCRLRPEKMHDILAEIRRFFE